MKRNWHLKVISFLLAAIIWFYVDSNDKPIDKLINIPLVKIGPSQDIEAQYDRASFDTIIDGRRKGICPGFVDSHVHLSETLSRAVFPDNLDNISLLFYPRRNLIP